MNSDKLQKFLPVIIAAAIILLGGTGFFLYKYQSNKAAPSGQASAEDVKRVVAEVGKLMELPQGEDPTLATVTDVTKLADQPFFARAKNGDQVLIYSIAKKAILYSPSQKKIIEVGPINVGTDSAQQNTQARIVLRNGTTNAGLANKVETEIKKTYPDANITAKDNSTKTKYEKTVVVYLNEDAKVAADNLAKTLNVTATNLLPEGEKKPENIDILIILGKDQI